MKDLIDLISDRRSIRSFLDKPVEHALVDQILTIANECSSGGNMHPYHVRVVTGETKTKLSQALACACKDQQPNPDYDYYPKNFFYPYDMRRHRAGKALYHACGITFNEKEVDWEGILEFAAQNYNFFGANIGLIFYTDNRLTEGAHHDIGIFMQNIMLLAERFSLGTCPQAALANFPDIVRKVLNIESGMRIVCGMSLGYPDLSASVNECRIDKPAVSSFTTWHY